MLKNIYIPQIRRFIQACNSNEIDLIKAMIYNNEISLEIKYEDRMNVDDNEMNNENKMNYDIISIFIHITNIKVLNLFLEKIYKEKDILKIMDRNKLNILMELCKEGRLDMIEIIIKKISKKHLYENINKQDIGGNTALYYAVYSGNVKVCKLLLENNANIELINIEKRTVLFHAAICGFNNIVNLFLKKYYNDFQNGYISYDIYNNYINNQDIHGYTPLMISTKNNYLDIVYTLINYKVNINTKSTFDGSTALMLSTCNNGRNLIKILTEQKDIKYFISDNDGMDVIDYYDQLIIQFDNSFNYFNDKCFLIKIIKKKYHNLFKNYLNKDLIDLILEYLLNRYYL